MVANLAEELYANSIQLKKYDSRKLLFNQNRLALEKELYQIQSQVNEIIILLKDNPNYSVNYIKYFVFNHKRKSVQKNSKPIRLGVSQFATRLFIFKQLYAHIS